MVFLECRCFERQTAALVESEHDVHVLHSLSYGTLQQIVYAGRYEHGVRGMKVYVSKLKRLDKRYEFQNRTKEMGRR